MTKMFRRLAPAIAALALAAAAAHAHSFDKGSLHIGHPWSRATAPTAQAGGGFLTITNNGKAADRLVSASSPRAGKVEIHSMTTEGGVMRMRPLPKGIEIAPGATVTLAPGGFHLMLIGLKGPLVQGEKVPATLRFEHAGTVEVQLKVDAPGAQTPTHAKAMPGMGHGEGGQ